MDWINFITKLQNSKGDSISDPGFMVPTPVISACQLQSSLEFESKTPGPQRKGKSIKENTGEKIFLS